METKGETFSWYLVTTERRVFLCIGPSGHDSDGFQELGSADEDITDGCLHTFDNVTRVGGRYVMLHHAHRVLDYFKLPRTTHIEREIPWAG